MENKVIVAVSGGPDSMYLLVKLMDKNLELVVAHVNYNLRKQSINEEKYLREFCKENNIKICVKNIVDDDWKKYSYLKNKQSIAREIRYSFFQEVSKKNNIDTIYIGHHKDDFIETAIMQSDKSEDYFFYGIKEKSKYKNLIIKRPLLNIYKNEIIKKLDEKKIKYFLDETNYKPIYERNRIRKTLSSKTSLEKNKMFLDYQEINKSKSSFYNKSEKLYCEFSKKNYSWDYYNSLDIIYKKSIIYKLLIESKNRININKNKLDSIIVFLEKKNPQKKYRLMKNIFITVKSSNIIILSK